MNRTTVLYILLVVGLLGFCSIQLQPGHAGMAQTGLSGFQVVSSQSHSACELSPADAKAYEEFLPEGRPKDSEVGKGGNSIRLVAKATSPATVKYRIRVKLTDVTELPGVCMNFGNDTGKDLRFTSEDNPRESFDISTDGLTITSKKPALEISVVVRCFDYGAYGKVQAFLVDDADREIARSGVLTVPKDEDGNKIADAAPQNEGPNNSKAASDDNDNFPQGKKLDGELLARSEEYRGFMSEGRHIRTSVLTKTVFVRDDTGWVIEDGGDKLMSWFGDTQLEIVPVGKDEVGENRQINFNGGAKKQRAIIVENITKGGELWGETKAPDESSFVPSLYTSCGIDVEFFRKKHDVILKLEKASDIAIIYDGRTDPDYEQSWHEKGKVKLEKEIIGYETGIGPGTQVTGLKSAEVAVDKDFQTIPLDGFPLVGGLKNVLIGSEVVTAGWWAKGLYAKLMKAAGKDDTELHVDKAIDLNGSEGYAILQIETEWISYTTREDAGDTWKLTGVRRGILGSTAAPHDKGKEVNFPHQIGNCKRAQFGTVAADVPIGVDVIPVGVLEKLSRNNADRTDHAKGVKFGFFSNLDDAARHVAAHEMGHVVSMDHHGGIMIRSVQRGAWLDGGGLFKRYDELSKGEINAR